MILYSRIFTSLNLTTDPDDDDEEEEEDDLDDRLEEDNEISAVVSSLIDDERLSLSDFTRRILLTLECDESELLVVKLMHIVVVVRKFLLFDYEWTIDGEKEVFFYLVLKNYFKFKSRCMV